jgi:prostaglandin-H2 D-isomerase / glutathione transferase
MSKITLTYFDAPVSRGEECRMALHLAGVDWEDRRLKREAWAELKPKTPFGSLPLLDVPGHGTLAQSNAILVFIGRGHGLHPADPFEAARHEAMMGYVEELRGTLSPTLRIKDEAEKKRAREELAAGYIPTWAANAERWCTGDGPFFGGAGIGVVDLKVHMLLRWIQGGVVDHIPTTIFDGYPRLNRIHRAVQGEPRIQEWAAKKR